MKALFLMAFSLVLLLSGCVEKSGNLTNEYAANESKIYKDIFVVRGKRIPLPPGEWRIAVSGLNAEKFFIVYLVKGYNTKNFDYIRISVDSLELQREFGYKVSEEPKRKDLHSSVVNKNVASEAQDWWIVNNRIMNYTPKADDLLSNQMVEYFKSHNYITSHDMVYAEHFLSGEHPFKHRHLSVTYNYSPEAEGFAPGEKGTWATSEWNAVRIHEDKRKADFVKELIEKHKAIHAQLQAGFHK